MRRLSEETLADLPPEVERPGYARNELKTGVVHLGVGAFHRAHQAVVFDDAIRAGDSRWGVIGASLRSPAVAEQLNPQDGLYSLNVRSGSDERLRVIGAVRNVCVAPADPAGLIRAMAEADVHLVTLTITEKGYLPVSDDIARPATAAGFIVAALAERRDRGAPPFTAISCDNLSGNGRRLESVVLTLARQNDPALADWIEQNGAFPETMVDRIVPATTSSDVEAISDRLGVRDYATVKTEPFLQWVIEDRFAGERPDFDSFGARITRDVAPWETAKLRMLNGAHSAIAYLGGLAGVEYVHQFVEQPDGAAFIQGLWDETVSTFDAPPELNLSAYRASLMDRFRNPALQHRTRQIAMDGSQKLPQRLVAPMAIRLSRGQPSPHLARAIAAWMRWQDGRDDAGRSFVVEDPLAETSRELLSTAHTLSDRVGALLSMKAVFPTEFALDRRAVDELTSALSSPIAWGVS